MLVFLTEQTTPNKFNSYQALKPICHLKERGLTFQITTSILIKRIIQITDHEKSIRKSKLQCLSTSTLLFFINEPYA